MSEEILSRLISFNQNMAQTKEYVDSVIKKANKPYLAYLEDESFLIYLVNTASISKEPVDAICCHLDVVPVDYDKWETNPGELVAKGNRYYGRGTTDMLGAVSCVLSSLENEFDRPLLLCFSTDEETDMQSGAKIVSFLKAKNIKIRHCLIPEATGFEYYDGSAGLLQCETRFFGKTGHSSKPELGDNAITKCVAYINAVNALFEDYRSRHILNNFTFNIGKIKGGLASNIIPDYAEISWEVRFYDRKDYDAVKAIPDKLSAGKADIETTVLTCIPPFKSRFAEDKKWQQMVAVTDGSFYGEICDKVFIYGPGDIHNAHINNEYIDVADLKVFNDYLVNYGKGII